MKPNLLPLLLTMCLVASSPASAETVQERVAQLEDEWAEIFYKAPEEEQADRFHDLLPRVHALVQKNPRHAEPLILEAIVLCTYAGAEGGFGALSKVRQARELLTKAISINPRAMEGSAYLTLGNLYYRLPGWPISYGNDEVAGRYLKTALFLFPDAIDTNYFYGDYLLQQEKYAEALMYLKKADRAPIRPHMALSDRHLKHEIAKALATAKRQRNDDSGFFSKFFLSFLP